MYGTRATLVLNLAAFQNKKYTANDRTVRMVKSADLERTNQNVRIYPKTTLPYNKLFYYIDTSILQENIPLVKVIRNHVLDSSGVFSISSLVKISMISLISSFKTSSGLPQKSSAIFGNHRKSSATLVRPLDKLWRIFRNLWKVVGNLRKIVVISMSI